MVLKITANVWGKAQKCAVYVFKFTVAIAFSIAPITKRPQEMRFSFSPVVLAVREMPRLK